MAKVRLNLYLDAELVERAKAALGAINSSVSEYVEHALRSDIDALELAADSSDPQKIAQAVERGMIDTLARELANLAENMRTVSEAARGKEKVE